MSGIVCEAVGGIYYALSFVFSSFEGVCDDLPAAAATTVVRAAAVVVEDPSWLSYLGY